MSTLPKDFPPFEAPYATLLISHLKHVTTLSTGSIFLQVGFLEKVFPHPKWKAFVVLSLLFLTTSIALAAYSMEMAVNLSAPKPLPNEHFAFASERGARARKWAWRMFLYGMIAALFFAIKNLVGIT